MREKCADARAQQMLMFHTKRIIYGEAGGKRQATGLHVMFLFGLGWESASCSVAGAWSELSAVDLENACGLFANAYSGFLFIPLAL